MVWRIKDDLIDTLVFRNKYEIAISDILILPVCFLKVKPKVNKKIKRNKARFHCIFAFRWIPNTKIWNTQFKFWNTQLSQKEVGKYPIASNPYLELWHYSLLRTDSIQEDPSRHNWKIVVWDVENQIKQNNLIKLTHYDETKKRTHNSQIVRAKENFKLSHGGPSYRQASGTNPPIKALRQSCHWVWSLTQHRAIKEETIALNHEWVYYQACRLSHDIQVISNFFFNVWLSFWMDH